MGYQRDSRGRFASFAKPRRNRKKRNNVIIDHNYVSGLVCLGDTCNSENCPLFIEKIQKNNVSSTSWREGRRVVEFPALIDNLKACKYCRLGPIPLTSQNVLGEMKKGLGGYLYIKCQNADCSKVNNIPYGKTYHQSDKKTGMPCFAINTKLGTAMIDSIGGPGRVNNFLSILNIPTINDKTLKEIERRAGDVVETVSKEITKKADPDAYKMEMADISAKESDNATKLMGDLYDADLGVAILPDASTPTKELLLKKQELTGDESDGEPEVLLPVNESIVTVEISSTEIGTPPCAHSLPLDDQLPHDCIATPSEPLLVATQTDPLPVATPTNQSLMMLFISVESVGQALTVREIPAEKE